MQTFKYHRPHPDDTNDEKVEEPPSSTPEAAPASSAISVIHLDTSPSARAPRSPRSTQATRSFRKKYYADISDKQWNDWRWQTGNRICKRSHLESLILLSDDEHSALSRINDKLPLGITPYYASLIDKHDSSH